MTGGKSREDFWKKLLAWFKGMCDKGEDSALLADACMKVMEETEHEMGLYERIEAEKAMPPDVVAPRKSLFARLKDKNA